MNQPTTDPLDEHLSNPDPQFLKAAVQAIINEREAAETMAASWKQQWASVNVLYMQTQDALERAEDRIEELEFYDRDDDSFLFFAAGAILGFMLFALFLLLGAFV